jgi:hypothetical protein
MDINKGIYKATERKLHIGDWKVIIGTMDEYNPTSIYIEVGRYCTTNKVNTVYGLDDTTKFNSKQYIRLRKEVDRIVGLSSNFSKFILDFMLPEKYTAKRNFIKCETTLYRKQGNLSTFDDMLSEAMICAQLICDYIEGIDEFNFI